MSDICMCTGNCSINKDCYRYMATPDPYCQTYSSLESVCIPNNYSEFIPYKKDIQKQNKKIISYTLEEFVLEQIRKKNKETN